jgi:thioesterase domain-containing protein
MPDTPELSETKRALLEKYLQGDLSQTAKSLLASAGKPETPPVASVLVVQKNGSKRPFFFLHGQWDGRSFYCYTLANRLGPDQPFYALDPYDLVNQQTLPTLEEMARTQLQIMRSIQPEGPYLLAGWCNGAVVAYEMARQLQAAGEKLDLLILMDASTLTYSFMHRVYYRSIRLLGELCHLGVEKQIKGYLSIKHALRLAKRFVRYRIVLRKPDPEPLSFKELRRDYARLYDWIVLDYKPQSIYNGKIIFFWAAGAFQTKESRPSWQKIEAHGENEVHFLPGDHITVRTDHLNALAELLYECVNRVQSEKT